MAEEDSLEDEDVGNRPARALKIPPYWLSDELVELTEASSEVVSAEEVEVGFLVVVAEVADELTSVEVPDFAAEEAESVSLDEADEVRDEATVLESEPSKPPRRAESSPPPVEEEAASEDELVRD